MAEDNPKLAEEVQGTVVGESNIIYNYFYHPHKDVTDVTEGEALPCPYRGLFHFGPNDAEFFFGREVFVEELFRATQTRNFITVLGASGSGKSSVVLAGLLPKLEQEGHWKFTHFRPGSDPFHALSLALVSLYANSLNATERITQTRQLANYLRNGDILLADVFTQIQHNYPNHRVLLIADQFEELYTLCPDVETRRDFLNKLISEFQNPNSELRKTFLVITMQVGFLGNALSYQPFADMLQNADLKLGPMNHYELENVIVKPAEKLGVTFEAGLVERILGDVEDQPGILPLLEFALTELWEKRTGKQLTHGAYEAIGQLKGALARYADIQYGNFTVEEREKVRRIFLQLVRPVEGAGDIRRIAMKEEFGEQSWSLVKQLADARLVVTSRNASGGETVEIANEALIWNWGQLREWIELARDFRIWQELLRSVKRQWEVTNKDPGSLLRGAALAEAEERLKERPEDFSIPEKEFIRQSIQEREHLLREKEEYRLLKEKEERRKRQFFPTFLTSFLRSDKDKDHDLEETTDSEELETIEEKDDLEVIQGKEAPKEVEEDDDFEEIDLSLLRDEDFYFIAQSFKNDLAQGPDRLNIKNEVHALAEVLVMRDLQPPLAVGICGGWGSGKSYAMHLIQQKITEIRCKALRKKQAWGSEKSQLSLYVGHIYQIRFDAWTFAKANLWSSLMQTIFYEFNRQLTLEKQLEEVGVDPLKGGDIWKALDEMSDEEREALLNSELSSNLFKNWKKKASESNTADLLWDTLTELRQEEKKNLKRSEEQLINKQLELQQELKKIEHDVKQQIDIEASKAHWKPLKDQLQKLMGTAFTEFIKQAKQELEESTEKSKQEQEANLLKVTLNDFQPTTWDKLYQVIRSNWKTFLAFIFFLILTIATPFLLEKIISFNKASWELLVTLIPLTPSLSFAQKLWKKWRRMQVLLVRTLKDYKEQVKSKQQELNNLIDERIKRKRKEKEIVNIEREIEKLKAQVERQRKKIGLTASYISLSDFVDTRLEEDFYGKKLGLMQQVQRDLTDLTNHFALPDEAEDCQRFVEKKERLKKCFPRGEARVILYIDDLDRCPPNRVVEVLESVQLLLKTTLFVVVLAIDDCYIARALEKVYKGVLKRGGKPSGIDYLEKIIQVPYRMRPISQSAIVDYLKLHMEAEDDDFSLDKEIDRAMKLQRGENSEKSVTELIKQEQPISTSNGNLTTTPSTSFEPVPPLSPDVSNDKESKEKTSVEPALVSNLDVSNDKESKEKTSVEPAPPSSPDVSENENNDQTQSIADKKLQELPLRVAKFTNKEFNILRYCCQQVDLSPRTIKRLINIYKILKIIWFRESNFGKNKIKQHTKQTIIACLALSGRYPQIMHGVFDEIETHFEEARDLDEKLVRIFLKDQGLSKDIYLIREWSKFCHDVRKLIPADLTLNGMGIRTFHLLLSFCFVGDPGYDPDDFVATDERR